ncbi:MAG: hypothetical protein IJ048_07490 [Clostridia bacterium]|nr:hypothetical protein [Clostridia bacterium]
MNPIRARIERELSGTGAFLRCDRGHALYVTNLPVKRAEWQEIADALERAKIWVEPAGQLLRLTPDACWADEFAAWVQEQTAPGDLTRQLEKRRGQPVCAEETACWLEGVKRLELGDQGDYERDARQAAAVALRKKCGGLMYACGACLDLMDKETK